MAMNKWRKMSQWKWICNKYQIIYELLSIYQYQIRIYIVMLHSESIFIWFIIFFSIEICIWKIFCEVCVHSILWKTMWRRLNDIPFHFGLIGSVMIISFIKWFMFQLEFQNCINLFTILGKFHFGLVWVDIFHWGVPQRRMIKYFSFLRKLFV